ncbi:hypothetical protein AI46_06415 [Burkholderia multivorans R-20526]|nr:hypothetical protein AI46_06415 [Burkholderia multivorans R-20526]
MPSRLQLFPQCLFPAAAFIDRYPYHAEIIARYFDVTSLERADPVSSETPYEVAQFEQNILARSRPQVRFADTSTEVVRRQQHDGESDLAVVFDLFHDGTIAARLFVQYDGLEFDLFEKSCNGFARRFVVTMNDEHAP